MLTGELAQSAVCLAANENSRTGVRRSDSDNLLTYYVTCPWLRSRQSYLIVISRGSEHQSVKAALADG